MPTDASKKPVRFACDTSAPKKAEHLDKSQCSEDKDSNVSRGESKESLESHRPGDSLEYVRLVSILGVAGVHGLCLLIVIGSGIESVLHKNACSPLEAKKRPKQPISSSRRIQSPPPRSITMGTAITSADSTPSVQSSLMDKFCDGFSHFGWGSISSKREEGVAGTNTMSASDRTGKGTY